MPFSYDPDRVAPEAPRMTWPERILFWTSTLGLTAAIAHWSVS